MFMLPNTYEALRETADTYCSWCPVAQECLNDSIWYRDGTMVDDLVSTIRGGYVPTDISPRRRGRPLLEVCGRGHTRTEQNTRWTGTNRKCTDCEKEVQARSKRETCLHGHPWVDENIVQDSRGYNRCKTCRDNGREEKRLKRLKNRKVKTKCTKGLHEWIDENIVVYGGVNRCKPCIDLYYKRRITDALENGLSGECRNGHKRTDENSTFNPRTGAVICKTCRNARDRRDRVKSATLAA